MEWTEKTTAAFLKWSFGSDNFAITQTKQGEHEAQYLAGVKKNHFTSSGSTAYVVFTYAAVADNNYTLTISDISGRGIFKVGIYEGTDISGKSGSNVYCRAVNCALMTLVQAK